MATPSLVQATFNNVGTAATTIAKAYGSNVGVHSSLIWILTWQSTATLNSIVDTLSSTTTLLKSVVNAGIGWTTNFYLISDTGATGGADTVTATFSAAVDSDLHIFEYTGNPGTISVVGSAISNTGTNTSPTPGSITVAGTQQLILTMFFGNGAASYSIAAPFTIRVNDTFNAASADNLFTTAGTYTPQWTAGNATQWTSVAGAFQSTNNASPVLTSGGVPYPVSFPGY